MAMIRIDNDRHINPAFVASMEWQHRHYMNGSDSILVITMDDGTAHRVKHEPWYLNGPDALKVEREIISALKEGEAP